MPRKDQEDRNAYQRKWYSENKQVYYDKNKRRRNECRDFIRKYLLEHPCVDCGEADIVVLDFDHVRGVKIKEVTTMAQQGYSIKRIVKEIEKCEVVCANDHRRRTKKRRQSGVV